MKKVKKITSKIVSKKNIKRKEKSKDLDVVTFKVQLPNWKFALLIVLFGVAIGQAALLFRLSDQVKAQDNTNAPSISNTVNNVGNSPAKQIEDLPDMVGGC